MTASGFENYGAIFAEDNVEILHGLLGEFDAVDDEQDALCVASSEKAANEGGAEKGLAGSSGHFEEKSALAVSIELLRDFVDGIYLIAAKGDFVLEALEVIRANDIGEERARRLKIFEAETLEVLEGRQALNAEGIPLVGALVIPKPVLFSVGENYEGGA
jgi:hypothetical protein